jgi:DNA-binding NarL/FixJ family response regulator
MANKISIVIADDHSLVRTGIRDALKEFPDLEIVGEAEDGPSLFAALVEKEPDCLLVDVTMPRFEPVEAIGLIRTRYPNLRILVVSAYDDDEYVRGLVKAGVDGYHLKDQPIADLRLAVERILAGEQWFSSSLVPKLMQPIPQPRLPLTTRQRDLLRLLQQGLGNRAIARRLGLSIKTVENNLTDLYRYLNVKSRLEAVSYVLNHPGVLALPTAEQPPASDITHVKANGKSRLSILLVDDSARYRTELQQMIGMLHPEAMLYEAENIGEAAHLAKRVAPQLVFVDVLLGNESGIHCTKRLTELSPLSRIIMISAYPDREFHRLGIEAGASAFLDKKDLDIAALQQVIDDMIS